LILLKGGDHLGDLDADGRMKLDSAYHLKIFFKLLSRYVLFLRNIGYGRVVWINVAQDMFQ
jgi:hypothetical protein